MGVRPHCLALLAACVFVLAAPAASARTLRDAVRVAVVQAYAGSGAMVSNFVFGDMRLMSLTRDDVCGSVKFKDGAGTDFFYSEGDVLLDTERHETVEERCRKPSRTRLADKNRQWFLVCSDAGEANGRECLMGSPLRPEETVGVLVLKTDRSQLVADFFLQTDQPDGRSVTLTIAGEVTKCSLTPTPQPGLFWPCDHATASRLFGAFADGKSMQVEFGGPVKDLSIDEFDLLFAEAERYLLTFPGSELKIPEAP